MISNKEFDEKIEKLANEGKRLDIFTMLYQRVDELVNNFCPKRLSSLQLHCYAMAFRLLADITYNELPEELKKAIDEAVESIGYKTVYISIPKKLGGDNK